VVLALFATQVVFDLYARSAVTSAAVEAARSVAGFASAEAYSSPSAGGTAFSEQQAITIAESRARAALGRYGRVASFAWRFVPADGAPAVVELNVRFDASASGFDLARPLALPGLNRFDRTVRVRVERITCPAVAACQVVGGTGTTGTP
jgi:hypothetical protein